MRNPGGFVFWGLSELVTLLFVLGLIFASRYFALRDRWTACRLGAEQLRIARMALPLLVVAAGPVNALDAGR